MANVAEADGLAGTGLTATATEGTSFSGAVATFANTGFPNNTAGDFTATIDWGDGTTDTGVAVTVAGGSGSDLTVSGSHTYADEGSFIPIVTLTDDAPGTASATATGVANVAEADVLTVIGASGSSGSLGGEQVVSTVTVTFADTGYPANTPSDFTATIDWGDGTTVTTTVTGSAGNFTVSGGHMYTDEGTFIQKVTLTDDAPGTASATLTGTFTVAEADVLEVAGGLSFAATEGTSFTGQVATFINTGYPGNPASDFTATIDWGDGTTPTTGTVSGSGGFLTVSGSHTYADEGTYGTTVTLTDDAPGTASATANGFGIVAEADTLSGSGLSTTATEGSTSSVAVATFSDTGYPGNTASDFTATIDWGDGTITAGTVSGGNGLFTVSGSHAYADEGSFNPIVTLSDDAPGTASATVTGTAVVAEADVLVGTGLTVAPTEGTTFSATVATFSDTGYPSNSPSDFTATIDWGDGTITVGTVSGGDGTAFTVSGTHTYTDEGSFTPIVTLTDDAPGTATATATGAANVAEADVLSGTATSISTTEGNTFSGQVATFTNTGYPGNPASDFTATIDWGDGTTDTTTVTGGAGSFTVSGTHTYVDEGTFTLKVTLTDDAPGTASATATNTAVVAEADVLSGTGISIDVTEGQSFSGQVATFNNTGYPGNPASDFTATIDWGDGTTTSGTVSGTSGFFTVSGTHTYADEGRFTPIVTLSDDAPGTASASVSAVAIVEETDALIASGLSVTPTEGTTFTGAVASFTDTGYPGNSPSDFTATIDWGDGTTTTGTVSGGSGVFTVSGSHTYADEGTNTTTVILTDDAPGTASATATGIATVQEGDVLVPNGITFTGTEGYLFSGAVASFSDTGYPDNSPSDFTATIDWGDGTTTAGTVTGGSGTFNVSGNHLYKTSASFDVKVTLTDDAPGTASATASSTAAIQEQLMAVGTGAGQDPLVKVYDAVSGNLIASFDAFDPHFLGGVTAAVGDVNGDHVPDIIVAAGPGGGPHVKIIDGTKLSMVDSNGEIDNAALLASFFAYDPSFTGGVFVAYGVSNGLSQVITGAGPGGGPHVKVIDGSEIKTVQSNGEISDSALVAQFYAYSPFFTGGVRVAAADLNGDGVLDIVTGAGPGGGPHVKAIEGTKLNLLQNDGQIADSALLGSFYAYTPTVQPSGGVFVAAITVGGKPIIVTGDGSAADGAVDGPLVKVVDATKLNMLQSNGEIAGAALLGNFFAYDPSFQGGVTVGADEINGDTNAEIITGAGPGGGPHVKVIDGNQLDNLQPNMEISDAALLDSFYAFSPFFNGGVFVGAGT
jgi:hypothetical protein